MPTDPGQPPTCVLADAEIIKLTVVEPLCERVNDGIVFVVPLRGVAPLNPFPLEMFQEYDTFGVTELIVIGAEEAPLQINCDAGEKVTAGAGLIVNEMVSGKPEHPFAVGITW